MFQQDNTPCYKSQLIKENLDLRGIPAIHWPPYPPDLNLIEHNYTRVKKYIQDKYFIFNNDPQRMPLLDLRFMIQDAWDAILDDFIENFYNS